MTLAINGILLLLLLIIVIQDMKYRAVSWIVFPVLLVVAAGHAIIQIPVVNFLYNTMTNLILLLVVMALVMLYFSVKTMRLVNISKELIGWGDILFFVCLAVLFSPMNFMLFIVVSLLFIAIGTGIYIAINEEKQFPIPLAGLQALFLILLIVVNAIYPIATLNSDEWLLELALMP